MTYTKDEAIKLHRKMWRWIAAETRRLRRPVDKNEYFAMNNISAKPANRCFCCEYALIKTRKKNKVACENCPIFWGDDYGDLRCTEYGTPYTYWHMAQAGNNWRKAADFAEEIAELPERII